MTFSAVSANEMVAVIRGLPGTCCKPRHTSDVALETVIGVPLFAELVIKAQLFHSCPPLASQAKKQRSGLTRWSLVIILCTNVRAGLCHLTLADGRARTKLSSSCVIVTAGRPMLSDLLLHSW